MTERTLKNGWHQGREYWCDGELVGWIGGCFDPKTLEDTGYYAQVTGPARTTGSLGFLVKNVSRDEAVAAVEEAAHAR